MAPCKPFSRLALALALSTSSPALSQPAPEQPVAEQRASQLLAAEEMFGAAEADRGERARVGYRNAANAYLLVWQTHFADPCRGREAVCARGEEVLYNASRAFRAAHELDRASEVSATLLDPQFHLHETALARKTLLDEGRVQQALAEYAKAASFYERFVEAAPKDEKAPEALLDAIVLRLALQDLKTAEQNAELWMKSFATKSPADKAKVVMAIAEAKRDAGRAPAELERYLSAHIGVVVRGETEHAPAIQVMLGTVIATRGDSAAARRHFERAAALDVEALVKRLPGHDPFTLRRLGKALVAMGKARLWLADQARDSAMKLTVRAAEPESLKAKREAVVEAEKLYQKVLEIQPVPPPVQVVEASARVARMRSQLWAQAHVALGPDVADHLLVEAKAAHRICVDMAVKHEAPTPAAVGCAKWLERHYPAERPPIREIIPRPKWSAVRFPKPRPLDDLGEEIAVTPK
jgi:tetratricopeptide (TPR) repeat protein